MEIREKIKKVGVVGWERWVLELLRCVLNPATKQ